MKCPTKTGFGKKTANILLFDMYLICMMNLFNCAGLIKKVEENLKVFLLPLLNEQKA